MSIIRQLREQMGIDQAYLARKISVSQPTISDWENNRKMPSNKSAVKLAEFFNVSVDYILGRTTNRATSMPFLSSENVTFPVIGDIAAGYDSVALDNWDDDVVEIPVSFLKGRKQSDYFVLRVKGDSMYPAYVDGDRVLVLKQSTLDYNGQVAAILYDDELSTLKKVEYIPGEVMRLVPINPNVPPIKIEGERLNHCRIIGVPRLLIRDIND